VGPGLGIILTLGFTEGSVARAAVLLFSFSLGFGIWFVLSGLAVRRALAATAWMRLRARLLQTIGGVFMVAIGVLLLTGVWETVIAPLRRWTATFAPPL
jgi:cytochrome c-type biogenesis protein